MKTGCLAYILDTCASFWATSVLLPVPSLVTANCPFVPIVADPAYPWLTQTSLQFQNQWKSQTLQGNLLPQYGHGLNQCLSQIIRSSAKRKSLKYESWTWTGDHNVGCNPLYEVSWRI